MAAGIREKRIREMFRQADAELKRPGRQLSIHPFILGVEKGALSRKHLRAWAEQVYLYVHPIVQWLGVTYGTCNNDEIRQLIWNSLLEEATGQITKTKSHPEIMADFAVAVGADRKSLRTNIPTPATRALLAQWELILCHRHWAVAMGGMGFGGERQIPATFRKATRGLATHYRINRKGRLFFDVHIGADEDHGDEAIEVILKAMPNDELLDEIHRNILTTAECMWNCWMSFEAAN